METLLSIIVPAFNAEKTIQKCLENILKCNESNYEIIVLDDGSSDNTLRICKAICEKNKILKVYSQENRGVSATRNKGIKVAKGKFIVFIDSDDFVEENYIDHIFKIIRKEKFDLYICGIRKTNGNNIVKNIYSNKTGTFSRKEILQDIYIWLKNTLIFYPVNKIYKKDILIMNKIEFNENINLQEDLLFNLEYLKKIEKVLVDKYIGYNYLIFENENSLSSKYRSYYFNDRNYVFKKMRSVVTENNPSNITLNLLKKHYFEHIISYTILQLCNSSYSRKDKLVYLKEIYSDKTTQLYLKSIRDSEVKLLSKLVIFLGKRNMITLISYIQNTRLKINKIILKKI